MKKYILKIYLLNIVLFASFLQGFAQKDTVFWFSAPEVNRYHSGGTDINPDNDGTPVFLNLTTFENAAKVTISMPANSALFNGGSPITVNIPANSTERLELSNYVRTGTVSELNSMENKLRWTTSDMSAAHPYINKGNKGIKISSDQYITAYYEISVRYNKDLISLKGENALGTKFYVPFQTTNNTRPYNYLNRPYSSIDIVATEDNTAIKITTDKAIWAKDNSTESIPAGTHTIWLNKGETSIITAYEHHTYTYNGKTTYQTSFDKAKRLSGSLVEVDQTQGSGAPIAVITHDDIVKTNYPLGNLYGNPDYVTDQLVPVELTGTDYAVIQGVGYDETLPGIEIEDYIYVVGTENGTNFTVKRGPGGATTNHTVNAGGTVDISMNSLNSKIVTVTSDKPVYVYHMSGTGRQKAGAIIPTISTCTGSYKVAFTRAKANPFKFYLTILTRKEGIGHFKLQRNSADVTTAADLEVLDSINSPYQFNSLPQTGDPYDKWRYARIDADLLTSNVAYLLVNDTTFYHLGVINGETNNDAFYGYFSNFNEIEASASEVAEQSNFAQVCEGDTIFLSATGGNQYTWTPNTYLDNPNISNPVAVLPPGIYPYKVHIVGPCVDDTLQITLECLPNPVASFTMSTNKGCAPIEVTMQNKSSGADKFSWDFTDNASWDNITTDSAGTVSYIYNNTTSTDSVYSVRMLARKTGVVCTDEMTSQLQIFPEMHAGFSVPDTMDCNPLTITFTDTSSGNLDKYQWDFDDGVTLNTAGNVTHEFSHVNTSDTAEYNVELRLTSPYFCRDTARKTIRVFPYLEGEFTIDTAFGCHPLDVTITNVSAGEDSIVLDFGDGSPSLDTSTFTTITHRYVNTGTTVLKREVILRALNDEGCEKVWKDTITVYPQVRASYTIDNPGNGSYVGCNSRGVIFQNTSNNGTHTASQYLWTFGDGSNSNSGVLTSFTHTYTNSTNNDKPYTFNLHAESQYGCSDDTSNTITIYKALANYTIDADEGCAPLGVNITNTSSGSNIGTWLWSYGDGDTDGNSNFPSHLHTYDHSLATTQSYNLRLTVTHSSQAWCSTFKETPIDVFPKIAVSYATTPAAFPVCDSTDVVFDATLTPNVASTSFEWDFGDGTSGSVEDPTHNYRNTINAGTKTYNVRVDAETPDGCTSFATGTVGVNPRVRAFFTIDEAKGCSPHSITVTPTSYIGISSYQWDFNGDGTVDINAPTAASQSYTFPVNTSGSDKPYNVTLQVFDASGNCSDSYSVPVTVYSETKANFDHQKYSNCNSFSLKFDNLSFNSNTWHWDFGDGTSSSEFEPTKTFTNTGSADSIYNVKLAVTSNRGCTDDTATTITVYPYVKADFDVDSIEGCSPLKVTITNNSKGGTYHWYWNDQTAAGSGDQTTYNNSGLSHTYSNSTGSDITFYLTLVAENANGCTDTLTKQILLHSSLTADFTINQPDACNPSDVLFTDATLPAVTGYTYNWDFGDGILKQTTSKTVSKTYTNTSDSDIPFMVTLNVESDNGCKSANTAQKTLTVYRYVKADFDVDVIEDCSPLKVNISNNSHGGIYRWYWNSQTANGTENKITNDNSGFSHTYTNTSGKDSTFYLTLVAENANGCSDTLTKQILVHSSIDAQFTFSQPDSCNQSDVKFTNTSVGGGTYTMNWDFGDGATQTTTVNTVNKQYTNNETNDKFFKVVMTAKSENGCTDVYTDTVTVFSKLVADFSIPQKADCPPFTDALIQNKSVGNANNTYQWFVDGSATADHSSTGLDDFVRTYDNMDSTVRNYSIRLLATNPHGCTDEKTGTISVYERVTAQFDMDTVNGCTPLNISFDNTSQKTADTKYLWTFGDGSNSAEFEPSGGHDFYNTSRENDRPYRIKLKLTSENYCTDTISKSIMVFHQPLAKFFIDKTSSCPPLRSYMDKTESLGEDEWEWRFGDGTSNNTMDEIISPYHEYVSSGNGVVDNYPLELWVGTDKGCKDSTSLTVNVFPSVTANFGFTATSFCSPAEVQFHDSSSAWVKNYNWKFRDGNESNLKDPTNRYDNTGMTDKIYPVFLRVSSEYNCWDTITKPVTVYVQPDAEFSVDNQVLKFPESTVSFTNLTNYGPFDYAWKFGDRDSNPSTERDPDPFVYPHWGYKLIELSVTNQNNNTCSSYDSLTVNIMPPDVNAEFITDINGGCVNKGGQDGLDVLFTASQSVFDEEYVYKWDFGDGESSEDRIVTHTYVSAGVYNVQLTARSEELNLGVDYAYKTIYVYPKPEANFEVSPKLAMLDPQTLKARVKFYNMTECNDTTGCSYLWSFGDGETAISSDVTHAYNPNPDDFVELEDGTQGIEYDIKLLATTSHGCKDSLTIERAVKIIGAGQIAFPNAFTPDGRGPAENETFKPVSEGVIQYQLWIYNRWGELIFTTKDLNEGWDGKIDGEMAKPDVYVWKAQGKFTNGRGFELAGDVTLIR